MLLLPVRRRPEVLARAMRAELIVGAAFFGGLQRLVGLGDFLEFLLAGRLLRHVRVVLVRELAAGLLDVLGAGIARATERVAVVLVLHESAPVGTSGSRPAAPVATGT